jgi:2-polyprenyl-3-methyl-5-hydroxy-6-metoxy-1,4-benzoquinol methylase
MVSAMKKHEKSVYYDEELVDPFSPDRKDFLVKAEHLMRYNFAKDYLHRNAKEGLKAVYDVACGNGYGTKILSRLSTRIIGLDKTRFFLEDAKSKSPSPNTSFYYVDLDTTSLRDFIRKKRLPKPDAVISFETIEHLNRPDIFVRQIYSVIAPGGYFICSVPNARYEPTVGGKPRNIFHKHLFRKKDIIRLIEQNNFRIIGIWGQPYTNIIVNYFRWMTRYLDRTMLKPKERFERYAKIAYPKRFLRSLTYSFIIIAQK